MREIDVRYDRRTFAARFASKLDPSPARASGGFGVSQQEMTRLLVEFGRASRGASSHEMPDHRDDSGGSASSN